MASRGFLIRFIDIGLIVLFGFIMISDIENSSLVDLASSTDSEEEDTLLERAFVTVEIAPTGSFTVAATASGEILNEGIRDTETLEGILRRVRDEWADVADDIVVLINPDEDSVVQRTVDVMDVCDRLTLKKSLQTDFGILGPGAP